MPYSERKTGAFRDWTEDHEHAELTLPLPTGTIKKELVVILTAESLQVRHTKLGKTLLRVEPFAGVAVPEESTWYVDADNDLLVVVIAKAEIGANKTEQHWGHSLAAKDGALECYLTIAEMRSAKEAREQREKQQEADRHARVKTSQRALRASEALEREKAAERAAEKAARKSKPRRPRDADAPAASGRTGARRDDASFDGTGWFDGGFSWVWLGFGFAALAILFEVGVVPLVQQALVRVRAGLGPSAGAAPAAAGGDSWIDDQADAD